MEKRKKSAVNNYQNALDLSAYNSQLIWLYYQGGGET